MTRRSLLLGIAGAAIVAVTGGWVASRQGAQQTGFVAPALAEDAATLPDIVLGQDSAPITVIEYASYTCPHCAHFHDDVFIPLKRDYIDTGKVKFIHREVYFDKFGLWAGLIAQCGGAPKYYAVSGMLYATQNDWIGDGKEATIGANLRKIGLKAGLSKEQIETCLNDQDRAKALVATYQKNAGADEITGTPSLVIDGVKHSNMTYAELKAILDAKL
ncbi:DsbA family protein [Paenirhodobacter sp. CAU 1674]|uniref:DsbA family protein n=1 Tax=Paenirhodobacter sp. CAU 1674 TaxID=3032596 RepID=UPI0023DA418D|nr:DsbA family protein [Paenirhodobacter sp. CAU 1674]MDF2140396.1 DsbA family protein [Paenirhodobacter sp. CAU 1674]